MTLFYYLLIGFVVASLLVYCVGSKILKEDVFPLPLMFIVSGLLWPVTIVGATLYILVVASYRYCIWLSNPQKMKDTFDFYEEVYILYGASGVDSSAYTTPRIWDDRIKKKYRTLIESDKIHSLLKTIYVNEDKFSSVFFRRMKYSWLPW